jgi:hypothetical protein
MPLRSPEIIVLTPRGGVLNHRYVTAEDSQLEANGCGRIYRQVKELLGESSFGWGGLGFGDGGAFAAARHVVQQSSDSTRRHGNEWLIVADPRLKALDAPRQKRLRQEVEDLLARLSTEVLDRIAWADHAESEVIKNSTLRLWRRDLATLLADVRVPEESTSTVLPNDPRKSLNLPRIAAVAALALGLAFLLAQFSPFLPVKPVRDPSAEVNAIVDRVAGTLRIQQPSEAKVSGQLASLFSDASDLKATPQKKPLADVLNDLRRATLGEEHMSVGLLEDDRFWEALKGAFPPAAGTPNFQAFLPAEDRTVLGDIPEPRFVRQLAQVVRKVRELDTVAARPDDVTNLMPLFKSIVNESEAITRQKADESLRCFTRADVALARSLLKIFQDEDVKRVICEVRARPAAPESLGTWMRTLGSPGRKGADGLFGQAYFASAVNVAEEKGSKPKQHCIELLREFCAVCSELARHRPAGYTAPSGAVQPRRDLPAH